MTTSDYGVWSSWLDAFARGDDLPADRLVPLDDRLGPHAQERVLRRIASAFDAREALWIAAFQRHMAVTSTSHQVADLASAMISARRRAGPLRALAESRLLPDDMRTALGNSLTAMLRTTQQSMEDSLRHSGPELLGAVRDNSLLRTPTAPSPRPATAVAPGRRVIL
jgi:hypothetical protein